MLESSPGLSFPVFFPLKEKNQKNVKACHIFTTPHSFHNKSPSQTAIKSPALRGFPNLKVNIIIHH